jgi:hypothetical protein
MEVFCDKKTSKNIKFFCCEICDFKCSKKGDWNRHILRPKHINLTSSNITSDKKNISLSQYTCQICNKVYRSRNGLWNHTKKCKKEINIDNNAVEIKDSIITTDLILDLIKDNKEMKQIILEQNNTINNLVKNGITTNNTLINNNSNNNTFNLQFFLNETCKDAMNISDFVDSLNLQLSDLEDVGKLGYVEGISNIIIKNLKLLDETKRPVHCTDKKRETIYIKDQGQWEKEDDNKTKLRKSIRKIAHKNIRLITQFREKYPECKKSESIISDRYNKMIIEAMGGPGDNTLEKEEKIMKNIAKTVVINK